MYVRGRFFWHVTVRTCTRFRRDCLNCYVGGSATTRAAACSATVHHCRETNRPVCTYTFVTRMTTLRTLRPGGSRLSGRIRRPFLACEVIDGGSELSGEGFIFFAPNMEALPCVRRCSWWVHLSASPRTLLFRWLSFVDHVDHAVRTAPRRWTTVRPRKERR